MLVCANKCLNYFNLAKTTHHITGIYSVEYHIPQDMDEYSNEEIKIQLRVL